MTFVLFAILYMPPQGWQAIHSHPEFKTVAECRAEAREWAEAFVALDGIGLCVPRVEV